MGKRIVKKIDSEVIKTIKKSSERFGQLYPILVDANEVIIDGEHRKIAIDNPKVFKLENIKTKKDRLEARLVANHARRGQNKSTWIPNLRDLAEILKNEGVERIGMKIAEETGVPYRTIMKYLPGEFKDISQSKRASHPRVQSGSPVVQKETRKELVQSLTESPVNLETRREAKSFRKVAEVLKDYEKVEKREKPKIECKEYRGSTWNAILVPKDFYEKLKTLCDRHNLDIEETVTLALMKLLGELRKYNG